MASKTSKKELSEFARRAMQRMEDKKTVKHQELYVPSVDSNIVIRNLDKAEVAECMAVEDNGDPTRADKYSIYLAVTKIFAADTDDQDELERRRKDAPSLKTLAMELQAAGSVKEPMEVMELFDSSEITEIATYVMTLSGVLGGKKVTIVESLKN